VCFSCWLICIFLRVFGCLNCIVHAHWYVFLLIILGIFFCHFVLGILASDIGHFFCWYLGVFNWPSLFETGVDCCAFVTSFRLRFPVNQPAFSFQQGAFHFNILIGYGTNLKEDCVFCPHQGFFLWLYLLFDGCVLISLSPLRLALCISIVPGHLTVGRSIHYYLGVWLLGVHSIPGCLFRLWIAVCVIPFFVTECVIPQSLVYVLTLWSSRTGMDISVCGYFLTVCIFNLLRCMVISLQCNIIQH
jgi:hypothetical protein